MRSIKKRIDQLERIAAPAEEYEVTIIRTIIEQSGQERSEVRTVTVQGRV